MSRQVKSLYQTPRYTETWEEYPLFKHWLSRGPMVRANQRSEPTSKAYCNHCEEVLEPTFKNLCDHTETPKHKLVMKARRPFIENHGQTNGSLEDSLESRVEEFLKLRRDYSLISSQVIDSMTGKAAEGLDIKLYKQVEGIDEQWELVSTGLTDSDGYLDSLIFHTSILPPGIYKLEYLLQEYYFEKRRIRTTYPMVQPTFEIKEGMVQYHFRVNIAPHFHQVYMDTEIYKPPPEGDIKVDFHTVTETV